MAVEFEWDPEKARRNLVKHGVDFEDAKNAVLDPRRIETIDDRFDYGEERVLITGSCFGDLLLVVTVSHADDHYRIISARPATRQERMRYFRHDTD